jgi:hypothetical protein
MLKIELQYFPTIVSCIALFNDTNIDYCLYENWSRQSFRNRMILAGANGLFALSIPLVGGRNQRGLYCDVRIDHTGDWQKRHWRSIFSAYGKSPWFFQYAPALEELYREQDTFLIDWNFRCLGWVVSVLRLGRTGFDDRVSPDGRIPDSENRKSDSVEKIGEYVIGNDTNPGGSMNHGNRVHLIKDLKDQIRPGNFQDPALGDFPRYSQVFEDRLGFQPNLSILDLVLCCGPAGRDLVSRLRPPAEGAA